MTRRFYSNLAPTVMTTGSLTASATSVVVTSVTGFPVQFPYVAAIERGTASEELVLVTSAVGTSLTVTRGYGGTTGKTHASSVNFEHVVDATDADEANAHVNATSAVHGTSGSLVGTTDTQTLTNKTLSSTTATATATDPGLITKAAASGTQPHLIGKDSTGVTTEYQVLRGGAASFKNTDVQALTATSVVSSGAVSGTTATLSGAVTGGSLATAGALTAGTAAVTGAVSGAGATFTGSLRASDSVTRIGMAFSSATMTGVTTETKDSAVGDVTFTAVTGRKYRVKYVARAEVTSGSASIDFRIRDGGASSPSAASTLLTSASAGTVSSAATSVQLCCEQVITGLSAGTHTVAPFVDVTTGAGSARAGQATGQSRQLTVYDEGTV